MICLLVLALVLVLIILLLVLLVLVLVLVPPPLRLLLLTQTCAEQEGEPSRLQTACDLWEMPSWKKQMRLVMVLMILRVLVLLAQVLHSLNRLLLEESSRHLWRKREVAAPRLLPLRRRPLCSIG
jgi:hypothetical protein